MTTSKGKRKPKKKATRKVDRNWLKSWLVQKLRRISYQFPPRKEALRKARKSRGIYICASCNGEFGPKQVQMDHIHPVIDPHEGFVDWNTYIDRLFTPVEGWQIMCLDCHKTKSFMENEIRKQIKRDIQKDNNGDDL